MTEGELLKKFNIVSRYSTHIPNTVERPWLGGMIASILDTSDHVYFGEPHINGNFLKTYEMFAQNPALFEAAAQKGVKHFVLEIPSGAQEHLDAYAAKEITREQLRYRLFENQHARFMTPWLTGDAEKQFRSNFIQALDNALAAGMQVHFADVSWQVMLNPPPFEIQDLQDKLIRKATKERPKVAMDEYMQQHIASLPPAERDHYNNLMKEYTRELLDARLDDMAQYERLRRRINYGDRIMGVAGLSHLDNSLGNGRGINNLLKNDGASVAVVEIYDSRNTQGFTTALQEEVRGLKNRDLPDYTIILDENAVLNKDMKEINPVTLGKKPAVQPPKLAA